MGSKEENRAVGEGNSEKGGMKWVQMGKWGKRVTGARCTTGSKGVVDWGFSTPE